MRKNTIYNIFTQKKITFILRMYVHVIYFGRNIYFAKMGCCNQGLGNPLGHIAVQGVIHHHAKS